MLNCFIYSGVRTPFGKRGGGLAHIRPDDLLGMALQELSRRSDLKPASIDDIIVGCANQAGEDSRCVARHAALVAGFPTEVPGTVIQRNCGSGLGALIAASHAITAGESDLVVAGGVESMSRAPFVIAKAEEAFSARLTTFDSAVGARFPNPRITEMYGADSMPQTADNLAVEYDISREAADRFAEASQRRYAQALKAGFFDDEIMEVVIPGSRKRGEARVREDEGFRPGTTLEKLAALPALNHGGVTTAGNAGGMNDGAAVLLLGSRVAGEQLGHKPIARVLASAVAGVEPRVMGIGPVPAAQRALQRASLGLDDMAVIEINEAFSAQVLACVKALGLKADDDRVNPNGGAIALGHPLGASGPRLALTAIREARRRGGRYALVSMCIGVGQGIALVLEIL
ncbi:acetyl-CoA C-acyltransferase [Billgrantia endophytica]|uniref:acetyl-CoA C-acyltransferase n=1 Tax=Billgrantia endophytica TaxID=2033802 RepID=A0A2N7TX37_9GAMM|nr:acetyl-CoA C-acyltransferase [Halomonas endophytica]PMR72758.1 acetyl-CoA C-acyltransferase [Halomonas endophytica]